MVSAAEDVHPDRGLVPCAMTLLGRMAHLGYLTGAYDEGRGRGKRRDPLEPQEGAVEAEIAVG
jgi:hypothetical protein